jgi:hypothetical protein
VALNTIPLPPSALTYELLKSEFIKSVIHVFLFSLSLFSYENKFKNKYNMNRMSD